MLNLFNINILILVFTRIITIFSNTTINNISKQHITNDNTLYYNK